MTADKSYTDDIRRYCGVLREIDKLNEDLERVQKLANYLEHKIINDMAADHVSLIELDEVGIVQITESRHPKVKDEAALYEFLRSSNQGDIIKTKTVESIHPSTFKKINSLHYEAHGCDLPGVEVYESIKLKIKETKS